MNRSKAKRRAPTFKDRAEAYVDSSLMTHRVRFNKKLFAKIQGNYGIYRTWASASSRGLDSGCTCPSDWYPSKHVNALKQTWSENPGSFFDVRLLQAGQRRSWLPSSASSLCDLPEG